MKFTREAGIAEMDRVGKENGHELSDVVSEDETTLRDWSTRFGRFLAPVIYKTCKACNQTVRAVESFEGDLYIGGAAAANKCRGCP